MNCDCYKEKEEYYKKDIMKHEKLEICQLKSVYWNGNNRTENIQPVIPVKITNTRDNTDLIINITVPYCPFCGTKQDNYKHNSQEITQFLKLKS